MSVKMPMHAARNTYAATAASNIRVAPSCLIFDNDIYSYRPE